MRLLTPVLVLFGATLGFGQSVPDAPDPKPIRAAVQSAIDKGTIGGAVACVVQDGRTLLFEAFGQADAGKRMSTDALFRIASMTKPVTSAAVMMLVEDGAIRLDDPLHRYLPEFADIQVLDAKDGLVAPRRAVTVRDLLTHTSGIAYGLNPPEHLKRQFADANLADGLNPRDPTLEANIKAVATIPLAHQPGTAWTYGMNTDVLGRVVEVASGRPFDRFLADRIFTPLRMTDTAFRVPAGEQGRLAALYTPRPDGKVTPVAGDELTNDIVTVSTKRATRDIRYASGGGGLVSTAADYTRFARMLLNEGELDGVRVLERDTVREMTRNQIGPLNCAYAVHGDKFGLGFGLGVSPAGTAPVGSYSWGGMYYTFFWIDPGRKLTAVLMTQLWPWGTSTLWPDFQKAVYASLPPAPAGTTTTAPADDLPLPSTGRFLRVFPFEMGDEHGNPKTNGRFRVNDPGAGLHPEFGQRPETKGNGMMQIALDEPLAGILGADLELELWGGHPFTANKRVTVNGRGTYAIPETGTAAGLCTHQYPLIRIERSDLVQAHNALQFACDRGGSFWGHFIVDGAALRVELGAGHPTLRTAMLDGFAATPGAATAGSVVVVSLDVPDAFRDRVAAVDFHGFYDGYDENGDGRGRDWHGMIKKGQPSAHLGTADRAPFVVRWDTADLPKQKGMAVRAVVRFRDRPDLLYETAALAGLATGDRPHEVLRFRPGEQPRPFWSRDNNKRACAIDAGVDPADVESAEVRVVVWDGGTEEVKSPLSFNDRPLPFTSDGKHDVKYLRLPVDPNDLRKGRNTFAVLSDTKHHGIEVLSPGPELWVRTKPGKATAITVRETTRFGEIDCYEQASESGNPTEREAGPPSPRGRGASGPPVEWAGSGSHRLLVRVDPVDVGNREVDEMPAELPIDLAGEVAKLGRGAAVDAAGRPDIASFQVMRYDPETGRPLPYGNFAYSHHAADRPFCWYDATIPYDFPEFDGSIDRTNGRIIRTPTVRRGYFFNAIGDGRSGRLAWAHTQAGRQPSWYAVYFSLLPPGRLATSAPPRGWIGDGLPRFDQVGGSSCGADHCRIDLDDWDGDGLVDLVVGESFGHVLWWPNRGTAERPAFPSCRFLLDAEGLPIDAGSAAAPKVVDWDRDGRKDLLVGAEWNRILYYRNVGSDRERKLAYQGLVRADGRTLELPITPVAEASAAIFRRDYYPVLEAADWDGDGDTDLLAGGYITGRIYFYENTGRAPDGQPLLALRGPLEDERGPINVGDWCAAPCAADFDGDGDMDLISGNMPSGAARSLRQTEEDRFLRYFENVGTRGQPALRARALPRDGAFPRAGLATPRAADWDADGDLDLIVSARDDLYLFNNVGTRTSPRFEAHARPLPASWGNAPLSVDQFRDWDGDGRLDLVSGYTVRLQSGKGNPWSWDRTESVLPPGEQIAHPSGLGDDWFWPYLDDFDGDGRVDVLFGDWHGHVWFHRNLSTPDRRHFDTAGSRLRLRDGAEIKVGPIGKDVDRDFDALQGARTVLTAADFDRDGRRDLVLGDTYGIVRLFRNVGTPTEPLFAEPVEVGNLGIRLLVTATDWDGDGWRDVIAGAANGRVRLFLNTAGRAGRPFAAGLDLHLPPVPQPRVLVADLNGDGDEDLFLPSTQGSCLIERSFLAHGYARGVLIAAERR